MASIDIVGGSVVWRFEGDTKDFDRANNQIKAKADNTASDVDKSFKKKLEGLKPTFKKMALAGTAAFATIGAGIFKAVDAAGRAEEIDTRFAATFDKTENRMRDFVSEFADQWQRAESDVKAMSATLGGTLRAGTQLAEDQIADLAQETILAAEGMAAFDERIIDGSQAMNAMAKAMVGNTGTLNDWGFDVAKATQIEKALELGLIDTKEEFDNNARAIAVQALIMEQSQGPIEALRNSEDDYAETKRRLNATIKETSESLGEQFLPIINDVLRDVTPLIRKVGDWAQKNPELTRTIVLATAGAAGLVAVIGALGLAITAITAHPLVALITLLAAAALGIGALITKMTIAKAKGEDFSASLNGWLAVFSLISPPLMLLVNGLSDLSAALFGSKIKTQDLKRAQEELKSSTEDLKNSELDLEGAQLAVERATESLSDAIRTFGEDSLEAREATHNLERAKHRVEDATDRVKDATDKERKAQQKVSEQLKNTKRDVDNQAGAWQNLASNIGGVLSRAAEGKRSILNPLGIKIPGFAEGVRNFRGGLAVVGEQGPELVNLPKGADVFPDIQSMPAAASDSSVASAPNINITVNMDGIMTRSRSDEREIAKSFIESINEELRSNNMNEIGGGTLNGFNVRRAT